MCILRGTCYLFNFADLFVTKTLLLKPLGWKFEIIFRDVIHRGITDFIHASIFLMVLYDKQKSIFSPEKISSPSIISYMWCPCKSSKWKYHITLFVTSSSGRKISTLVVNLFLSHLLVYFNGPDWSFFNFFAYMFSIIIEDIDMGYNKILIQLYFSLQILPFISPTLLFLVCILNF